MFQVKEQQEGEELLGTGQKAGGTFRLRTIIKKDLLGGDFKDVFPLILACGAYVRVCV